MSSFNSNIYNEKCRRGNIKLFSEIGGDMYHLRRWYVALKFYSLVERSIEKNKNVDTYALQLS